MINPFFSIIFFSIIHCILDCFVFRFAFYERSVLSQKREEIIKLNGNVFVAEMLFEQRFERHVGKYVAQRNELLFSDFVEIRNFAVCLQFFSEDRVSFVFKRLLCFFSVAV